MNNLVIVESPTKAKTLAKFLGSGYKIEASMGHIRDLPKGEFGVDLEDNFNPQYVIPRDKRKKVNELQKLASEAKNLWLATDPDREGEAIAWHLQQILTGEVKSKSKKATTLNTENIKRVEFHEITKDAIIDAFNHPRDLNINLVDAQQARRVLDRVVGYKLSPVLWEKVKRGLSAGRVQTVALRLIVEREREIQAFQTIEYWSIEADLEAKQAEAAKFTAAVVEFQGQKLVVSNKEQADQHVSALQSATYQVSNVIEKEVKRNPSAPFTTSTLQQTAGNRLGYSAKKTMMLAQNLYEQGFITYMRTDSVNLSAQALAASRDYLAQNYGKEYLPATPRQFKSKVKNAQEAHEAIRPTNLAVTAATLEGVNITKDHQKLYELIWKRLLASQMAEAVLKQTTIEVSAGEYLLKATGSVIQFDGWLKLYGVNKGTTDKAQEDTEGNQTDSPQDRQQILPQLAVNQGLELLELLPEQHFTEPPPRFTEATLVKKLEELGIGRPSTYAPILSTIQERFYVERQERKFLPTSLGMTVSDFLVQHFPETFDYTFTAEMEENLDAISRGEQPWQQTLSKVYQPLEQKIAQTRDTAEKVKVEVEVSDRNCPKCGKSLVVRTGRFGKFFACSGFPECKHTEAMEEKIEAKCPKDQGEIVARRTKKGRMFYGCKNYPNCDYATWTKPGTEKSSAESES